MTLVVLVVDALFAWFSLRWRDLDKKLGWSEKISQMVDPGSRKKRWPPDCHCPNKGMGKTLSLQNISGCLEDRPRAPPCPTGPESTRNRIVHQTCRHVVVYRTVSSSIPILGDVGLGRDPKCHAARQWGLDGLSPGWRRCEKWLTWCTEICSTHQDSPSKMGKNEYWILV